MRGENFGGIKGAARESEEMEGRKAQRKKLQQSLHHPFRGGLHEAVKGTREKPGRHWMS